MRSVGAPVEGSFAGAAVMLASFTAAEPTVMLSSCTEAAPVDGPGLGVFTGAIESSVGSVSATVVVVALVVAVVALVVLVSSTVDDVLLDDGSVLLDGDSLLEGDSGSELDELELELDESSMTGGWLGFELAVEPPLPVAQPGEAIPHTASAEATAAAASTLRVVVRRVGVGVLCVLMSDCLPAPCCRTV